MWNYLFQLYLRSSSRVEERPCQHWISNCITTITVHSLCVKGMRSTTCVSSINSFLPDSNGGYVKLCDGVGMQSYIGGYGQQQGCMNEESKLRW